MKCLIVGRGLAGAWLAWYLVQEDVEVTIAGEDLPEISSRVAAGLINPTTGSRPKSTWRSEVILPFAQNAYAEFTAATQVNVWKDRRIRRVFLTQKDQDLWNNAVERGVGVDWVGLDGENVDGVPLPFGGVEYDGATVDTNALLDAMFDYVSDKVTFVPAIDTTSQLDYDLVFWANGWTASQLPMWSWLPFQPVKGEILDAVIDGPPLTAVHIRGIWIVPGEIVGGKQRVRIGATHDWDNLNGEPTAEARNTLIEKARVILDREIEVVGQRAAVRPAARSKRPYLGRHPEREKDVIMNGLGAKGSLWAPWAAHQLTQHVFHGKPLDEEVDIKRWWNDVR